VVVHSAGIQDRVGARAVLIRRFRQIPDIRKVFADGGHTGKARSKCEMSDALCKKRE
jgi:hypothetical protein